jgi:hypothetical protein
MRTRMIMAATFVSILSAGTLSPAHGEQPKVEVVFCLDTTGSMGGLIEGAKLKIWSITNRIAAGKPTPSLSIGLIAYRDVGDQYVTKVFPLDDDTDAVFDRLQSLSADGGGDTPEHVNKALADAVHKTAWSVDPKTLKLVFLVGDCPPHMDYEETTVFWKDIAKRAEGEYAAVAQDGGMQAVETPFDAELAELGGELEGTLVAYGTAAAREAARTKKEKIDAMAPAAAAERAFYRSAGSAAGFGGSSLCDLIDSVKKGTVKLEELEDEELPAEMRRMNPKERAAYLAKKEAERARLAKEIEKLSAQRNAFIEQQLEAAPTRDSFDSVVQAIVEAQAARKGISY